MKKQKKYVLTVTLIDKDKFNMNVQNQGFNTMEIVCFLQSAISDLLTTLMTPHENI